MDPGTSKESCDIDPDYESTHRAIRDAQIREEHDNQLTEEKLHHIIKDEFDKELKIRQKQIEDIEDKVFKAQKLLHIIRYVLISSYYKTQALEYESVDYEGTNILNGQNRIHPAVKKLLIGNSRPFEYLAPLGKRKAAITSAVDTTLSEPSNKKSKLDLGNLTGNTCSNSILKSDVTIKHTDQEILTNRKKVQHQIVVGNTSLYKKTLEFDNLTHKWMVYIKVYKGVKKGIEVSNIIDKVIFYLHPSYSPHDVVEIRQPPFHLSRRGWGEFPLRVQIFFKSSINKPVDVIHHLKLSKTFSERQTLGNETVVPIFLYDSNMANAGSKNVKVKQEKTEVPEIKIKKEKIETIESSKVPIKQESIWESVENLVFKQELTDPYLEPSVSSDVDSYFDNRDSFSENMSETNLSDDFSWEKGFKGFKKEEVTSDLESEYNSVSGKDNNIDIDIEECKTILKTTMHDNTLKLNSHAKKENPTPPSDLILYNRKEKIEFEGFIDINSISPETRNKISIIGNDIITTHTYTAENEHNHNQLRLDKQIIIKPIENSSSVLRSNIKTNSSILEHSYSLPFYKEENGKKSSVKKSPVKQPPNHLIYGLGLNYESSTGQQKPSPQVLKVLRTASGQSIRLLPESFSQILLSNGGMVQLKLLQNQNSPNATTKTYAISNSDLLKLNLKPSDLIKKSFLSKSKTKEKVKKLKFPRDKFKNMGEALPCLFKQMPLWSEHAKDVEYKALFPFTARSKEEFESWSFPKRVNAEWFRARTIKSILAREKYSEGWNTKAILMYGRSHFYTPLAQYNLFKSEVCRENKLLADVFSSPKSLESWFSCGENGGEVISVDDDLSDTSPKSPLRQIVNLVDQKRISECAFVKEEALSCGVLLKQEELCKGVFMNAPERIILEAVKSFAEGLIRRAKYFAILKGHYSDSTPIKSQEVLAALHDRPEFKSIEKFQKTKITKDFFS